MPTRLLFLLALWWCIAVIGHAAPASTPANRSTQAQPAIAFWYGANPPWAQLQAFDMVVVDPSHVPAPESVAPAHTRLAAYVAVGEVQPGRDYAARMNPAWFKGDNAEWGSRLIDQAAPGWPEFFTNEIISPLWQAGYRAFFLDTLDSYHRFAKTPEQRAAQEAGMVRVIAMLKQRYPSAQLIFNRGFEILERTHAQVFALAAESLFQGYDAGRKQYRPVPEADREWLLGQLNAAHTSYQLPVISIDYVPPGQTELARETARQITALGFIPWVAQPELASLGVGAVEAMPRKVLVIHDTLDDPYELRETPAVRYATMPLNYLGYDVDYADSRNLPDDMSDGRYAGVVVWLIKRPSPTEQAALVQWLSKAAEGKLPLAFVGDLSLLTGSTLGRQLGVSTGTAPRTGRTELLEKSPMMGFERAPPLETGGFDPITLKQGQPLLVLGKGAARQTAAALTPWGGYVMGEYAVATLATNTDNRWVVNPFEFFSSALRLPVMPVPDATTESGRRLLYIHMDGDGFLSRAEFKGNPFAGEVLRDQVVRKYRVPMSISIIEAELSPDGKPVRPLRPLERVAREIFAEPNVEIASHSFSHPFYWHKMSADSEGGYSLAVPGYRFDLAREVDGSIDYIENYLAPPGKKVQLFLWTGDCNPGEDAVARSRMRGVLNMNGGDTVITRSNPTVTAVEGLGMAKGAEYQIFASNQNENVYTNNWTGPFNGFERVIETFEMTDTPRRLKPINIYFHTYVLSKRASLASFERIMDYALKQETLPIFASEYARKVLNFRDLSIARVPDGWRIRGAGALRTVRLPRNAGIPDLRTSEGIAGYRVQGDIMYVHLAGDDATLRLSAKAASAPNLVASNGRIESVERSGERWRWRLQARVPLEFTLQNAERCEISVAGKRLAPARREGALNHYRLSQHAAEPLEANCR